jgi:hypothetical protein
VIRVKVKIEIRNLSPLKLKLLRTDLEHTRTILLDEMQQTAEKLRSNRALQWKIVRLLSKVSKLTKLSVESFANGLEMLTSAEISLFDWNIVESDNADNEKKTVWLYVSTNDTYFQLTEMMPGGGFLNKVLKSKDKFVEELKKTIEKDYVKDKKDYTLEVIADDAGK